MQLLDADALCLTLVDAGNCGHDVFFDAFAEAFHVVLGIVITSAGQIRIGNVVLVADQLCIFGTDLDHLVIDIVQLIRNACVHLCPLAERAFTHFAIRILHEFQKSVEIACLAHVLGRAACGELGILAPKHLILGHAGNQAFVRQLDLRIRLCKDNLAEFLFQLFTEGMIDHCFELTLVQHHRFGKVLIVVRLLRIVKLVLCVHVMPDMRDREHRRDLLRTLIHGIIRVDRFLRGLCVLKRFDQLQTVRNELVDVHAFIGQFREFPHSFFLLFTMQSV